MLVGAEIVLSLAAFKKHTFDIPLHVLVGAEIVVTTSFLQACLSWNHWPKRGAHIWAVPWHLSMHVQ